MSGIVRSVIRGLTCLAAAIPLGSPALASEPLTVDSANPHYLIFRGKPTILIGASEHYGSAMNRSFNYVRYLETISSLHLNATRVFSGQYRERPGKFGLSFGKSGVPDFEIVENSLAPVADEYIAPWQRSNQPGAGDGGNKFDLSKWNPAYFARLTDFVHQASDRGIVVEVSLFSPYYHLFVGNHFWEISPLNIRNNINGVGNVTADDALSLKDKPLLAVEDALVRKIVGSLQTFDNVYYEICNEPWTVNVPSDWQAHVADVIADADRPSPHLIAQEYGLDLRSGGVQKIEDPVPHASVFLFHAPPQAIPLNYAIDKPLGVNETGGGIADAPYRIQAWQNLLSGAAVFIDLDYSFTAGHEDGSLVLKPGQPGGGSAALRRELGVLRAFMNSMKFTEMQPVPSIISAGLPKNAAATTLAQVGSVYAIYLNQQVLPGALAREPVMDSRPHKATLALDLPSGSYVAKWIDTKNGVIARQKAFTVKAGKATLSSPRYVEDIALRISRVAK
jgi:hypothetical protein